MTRQPDPMAAIRAAAPEGYDWLCTTMAGIAWWQTKCDASGKDGDMWGNYLDEVMFDWNADEIAGTAIHLPTGTVHLQQPDGTIIEVTRKEWDV